MAVLSPTRSPAVALRVSPLLRSSTPPTKTSTIRWSTSTESDPKLSPTAFAASYLPNPGILPSHATSSPSLSPRRRRPSTASRPVRPHATRKPSSWSTAGSSGAISARRLRRNLYSMRRSSISVSFSTL